MPTVANVQTEAAQPSRSTDASAKPAIILDTNIFVSGVLFPGHTVREVLRTGFAHYKVVVSEQTWDELAAVIQRPEFEKRLLLAQRLLVLETFARLVTVAQVHVQVTDCRDPKDNKFLALALAAQAKYIVTGDDDLLALHPWRGVSILNASNFLAQTHI
jgi:uncharacterized protein